MLIARHHKLGTPLRIVIVVNLIVRLQLLFGIAFEFILLAAGWLLLVFVICVLCVCVYAINLSLVFITKIAAVVVSWCRGVVVVVIRLRYSSSLCTEYELTKCENLTCDSNRIIGVD